MTDNRARVPLNGKVVNLAQLDVELSGHGLSASSDFVVATEGSPVTEAELAAAVAGHVPGHVPLNEMGRLITLLSLYEGNVIPPCSELVKMVDGLTVDDVQAEFFAWLEVVS